jgi:AcrR family transcriptional regulator
MDRKQQIVDEATRMFSQHGYDSVTIKDLAATCGISEPALYRYFPSKEAIYDTVLDSLRSHLNYDALFERLKSEERLDVLLPSIAEHILEFFNNHRDMNRLLLYSTLHEHKKARKVFREIRGPYVEFLHGRFEDLYKKGIIRTHNTAITARCFIGMVFDCSLNATMWKGFYGKTFQARDVIANNVPIFVRGLTKDDTNT